MSERGQPARWEFARNAPRGPRGEAGRRWCHASAGTSPAARDLPHVVVVGASFGGLATARALRRDKVGLHVDHDTRTEHIHAVRLTPPGSGSWIVLGDLASQLQMAPGSMKAPQFVVSNADSARQDLSDRGVQESDLRALPTLKGPSSASRTRRNLPGGTTNGGPSTKPLIPKDHTRTSEWTGRRTRPIRPTCPTEQRLVEVVGR